MLINYFMIIHRKLHYAVANKMNDLIIFFINNYY